jgi:hypothetical protein
VSPEWVVAFDPAIYAMSRANRDHSSLVSSQGTTRELARLAARHSLELLELLIC